jgi:hypothetical protein
MATVILRQDFEQKIYECRAQFYTKTHIIPANIGPSTYAMSIEFFKNEEDFPQCNLLQRGGKRPQEERRGCSGRPQQNEVPPVEFYSSLEEGVPERVAPAVFGFPQRGEFPGEQTVWLALAVFEIRRAPLVFLYCFTHFPMVMVRVDNSSS